MSIQTFYPFFQLFCLPFCYWVVKLLLFVFSRYRSVRYILQIFSLSVASQFFSLMVSFDEILMEFIIYTFLSFMVIVSCLKKYLPTNNSQAYSNMFSFRSSRSAIHFEIIFVYIVRQGLTFSPAPTGYPVFWYHLLKSSFFPHWIAWVLLLKTNEVLNTDLLLDSLLFHWCICPLFQYYTVLVTVAF